VTIVDPVTVAARPGPRRVSLRAPSRTVLGDTLYERTLRGPSSVDLGDSRLFHPDEIEPYPRSAAVPLAAIVFLARLGSEAGPARREPIPPAHALLALLPYTNRRSLETLGDTIRALAPLADRVPAFDLGRGPLTSMAETVEALTGWRTGMSRGRLRMTTSPPATSIALMVTRRCNMKCGHCSVESGPDIRVEPTERELLDHVRQAAVADVRGNNLTGGEPMLRPRTVLRLVRAARRLGVLTSLTTNGSWGRTAARARRGVRELRRAGLASLVVSVDRYHDEFQGPMPALLIARAAEEVGLPVRISLVVPACQDGLGPLVATFDGLRSTRLRFYPLQAVGRAQGLPTETMGEAADGFCAACAFPAVTDDGRLTACNGPAYFAPDTSPLIVGSLREETLGTLLARHRQDTILDTIRVRPRTPRDSSDASRVQRFPFRARYRGICDLCPTSRRPSRRRRPRPQAMAERRAAWLVIRPAGSGRAQPRYINGPGAGLPRAAAGPRRGGPRAARSSSGGRRLETLGSYLAACGSPCRRPG
jgi:MoaA/NifB/PqqE/SkfB family radical SAM enzyme